MNLYDEEQRKRENKRKEKLDKIIIASIAIVIILIIALICIIYYLTNNPNKITININGKESSALEELIEIETAEDGTTSIYAPIKDIAEYFEYKSFNGEYTTVSENTDSCYVENENEVAIFNLDSNVIYKLDKTLNNAEYEQYKTETKVFEKDGKLYTDKSGLEKGYNIYMYYNENKKILDIYTLDTLVDSANTKATNNGYESMDDTFSNQKAVLDDMIVVISKDKLYGVISYSTGKEILGAQYDSVVYIPGKSAFFVEKNQKVGIISSDGTTKISPKYDNLILIDNEKELYLAENDGLYGVVDINGNTIIFLEYDKIGVDITNFQQDGLKTGYILLDKLIPVKQGEKWGFFDKEGKQVTELIYDKIGCISSTNKSVVYNLLYIQDYNVVVVNRDGKYTFMDLNGTEIFSCVFTDIYMEKSSGKEKYYMVWNEKTYDAIEYLERTLK